MNVRWLALALAACRVATPDTPTPDTESGAPITDTPATDTPDTDPPAATLVLSSPAFVDQGTLPVDYTCDGAGHSPPLTWTGAPADAASFAVLATTQARDGEKWNWVLYDLPADLDHLDEDTPLGTAGRTSDGPELDWAPPCSQGPGAKSYTFTLYALRAPPTLPADPAEVTGPTLTAAVADLTLAQAALTVSYTR